MSTFLYLSIGVMLTYLASPIFRELPAGTSRYLAWLAGILGWLPVIVIAFVISLYNDIMANKPTITTKP